MRLIQLLPEVEGEEMNYIRELLQDVSEEDAKLFASVYRVRRRDPQTVLLFGVIGLFVIPGIQRFYVNQIGMGILYFLTIGLLFIGSIVDIINYRRLALRYNSRVAREALAAVETNGFNIENYRS